MRNTIKSIYKKLLPDTVLTKIDQFLLKIKYKQILIKTIDYLDNENISGMDLVEQKNIHSFLKTHGLHPFPYNFTLEYLNEPIQLLTDKKWDLPFVLFKGKKLYFPKEMNHYDIRRLYRSLLMEQDKRSPHHYHFKTLNANSKLLDCGGAEGIFTLNIIDKIKTAIIVEGDPKWLKPLEATFTPYREKVTIVPKFISEKSDANNVTLNEMYQIYGDFNQIKMDIEGMEVMIVQMMKNISKESLKKLEMNVCTYHRNDDAEIINDALRNLNFKTEFSNGYSFFFYDENISPPYLRKTLLKAVYSDQ